MLLCASHHNMVDRYWTRIKDYLLVSPPDILMSQYVSQPRRSYFFNVFYFIHVCRNTRAHAQARRRSRTKAAIDRLQRKDFFFALELPKTWDRYTSFSFREQTAYARRQSRPRRVKECVGYDYITSSQRFSEIVRYFPLLATKPRDLF